MIRYGTLAPDMRPMNHSDVLTSRLKLLVIMAKATLKGYPIGEFRKAAIVGNARFVFYETLGRTAVNPSTAASTSPSSSKGEAEIDIHSPDHLFLQRAQLLAVMMNSFSQGKSPGRFRKKAIAENIEQIDKYLSEHFQLKNIEFLKVA